MRWARWMLTQHAKRPKRPNAPWLLQLRDKLIRVIEDFLQRMDRLGNPGFRPDGVGIDFAVGLRGDIEEGLGLPVKLLQIEAHRAVEVEQVRADRLARGVGHAHARKAEHILERAIDQDIAEPVKQPAGKRHRLLVEQFATVFARHADEIMEQLALEETGIFHADHHAREQKFERARRREIEARPDFAQVGHCRVAVLRACRAEARHPGAFDVTSDAQSMRLMSDLRIGIEGSSARARHQLAKGEQFFCALSWSRRLDGPRTYQEAVESLDVTSDYWRAWLDTGRFPDHRWRRQLQRSALVLKGLTYAPTGAVVAAPTTSLPETAGGERNWDYRYTWMRDATFTLWGLNSLGLSWEADDFIQFVADLPRDSDGSLQIMYGIGGERNLAEQTLDHLTGYEGARPVRVGNGAFDQRQNDVYGAVLDSIYLHSKAYGHNPQRLWPVIEAQAERAAAVWREPDQGIWEARGGPRHYVSSKLMCWVALDRGARLAARRGRDTLADNWRGVANTIHADICERGVDDRGVFVQHYDTVALDASNLLIPLVRFLPAYDPRVQATVRAIESELTEHGLVLRYRVSETNDGFAGQEEGSFLICSFWLVSALLEIGERGRGRALCERLLAAASPLDLYAEELDPHTGRHMGNFPQAFTHLALINAVLHVIRDEHTAPLS